MGEEESATAQWKSDAGDKMFLQLAAYKEEHGDCRVPVDYPQNPQLGKKVARLRNQYSRQQKGKKSNLTEKSKNKLDSLGFVWEIVDDGDPVQPMEEESATAQWKSDAGDKMFLQLAAYKEEHGDCRVPGLSTESSIGEKGCQA